MSQVEVIDLVVSEIEVQGISSVAAKKIVEKIKNFATRYNVTIPYNMQKIKEDFIIFLTKRKIVNLRKIRVGILEGGDIAIDDDTINLIESLQADNLLIKKFISKFLTATEALKKPTNWKKLLKYWSGYTGSYILFDLREKLNPKGSLLRLRYYRVR
jgi:hypothetical protein